MSKKYLDLDGLEEVVEQINAKYAQLTDIPTTPSEVGALPATTKYGAGVTASVNTSTYVCTFQLKDQDGNNIGNPATIDLPIESAIVNASYDNTTKDLTFTLQNGNTVTVPMDDIISGLQEQLVSGTNIKTVNGLSLLGSGNIDANDVKEITEDTNIWTLDDGVYMGAENKLYYTPSYKIANTSNNVILFKVEIAGLDTFVAFGGDRLYYGSAGSMTGGSCTEIVYSTILKTGSVVNNLTSTSTTAPLSANMGKTLKGTIDNMPDTAITTAEIEALF